MKSLFVLCFALAACTFILARNGPVFNVHSIQSLLCTISLDQAKQRVLTDLMAICPPTMEKRIVKTVDDLATCIVERDYSHKTVCSVFRTDLRDCGKPLMSIVKECAPAKVYTLVEIIQDMVTGSIDYFCQLDVEHALEFLNPCLQEETEALYECVNAAKEKMPEVGVLGKSQICEVISPLGVCLVKHIQKVCKNPITVEATLGLLKVIKGQCVEENLVESEKQ